MMLRNKVKRM